MDVTEIQQQNVVQSLKSRIAKVRKQGFNVRLELLDDEQASWCVVGGTPTIIIDLSQTAHEQLQQLDEIIEEYQNHAAQSGQAGSETQAA